MIVTIAVLLLVISTISFLVLENYALSWVCFSFLISLTLLLTMPNVFKLMKCFFGKYASIFGVSYAVFILIWIGFSPVILPTKVIKYIQPKQQRCGIVTDYKYDYFQKNGRNTSRKAVTIHLDSKEFYIGDTNNVSSFLKDKDFQLNSELCIRYVELKSWSKNPFIISISKIKKI